MKQEKIKVSESTAGSFQLFITSKNVHIKDMWDINSIIETLYDAHYGEIAEAIILNQSAKICNHFPFVSYYLEGLKSKSLESLRLIFFKGSMVKLRDWEINDYMHHYEIYSEIRTEYV